MVEQDVHYSHSRLFNNTNRVDFKPLLISNAAVGKAFETRQLWPAGTRMNCGVRGKVVSDRSHIYGNAVRM